ncbi:unnamed protein product [Cylicocyclus nassatus]|uniref:Uncharacterized protein n=1 Tax=Cylicocyclus nassatus TaxID=53992 RepID=A0AA36H8N3_CYLNA|nr:unnamed protein product [Cylicocyclus nassatus]
MKSVAVITSPRMLRSALYPRKKFQLAWKRKCHKEFIQSDVVARATTTYGSLNRPLGRDPDLPWGIANRITAEIARAMAIKTIRCLDTAERPLLVVTTTPSVTKCTRMWKIDAEPPLGEVNLLKECKDWHPRKKDTPYVQVSAMYRQVLQRICSPPERIREYSFRINTLKRTDLKLKSFPRAITDTLIDMVEDMAGYGREELEQFRQINLQESTYYQNLGSTEAERRQTLDDLKEEKKNWRPQLFKLPQLALGTNPPTRCDCSNENIEDIKADLTVVTPTPPHTIVVASQLSQQKRTDDFRRKNNEPVIQSKSAALQRFGVPFFEKLC